MATNSTPTAVNHRNDTGVPQVFTQEHYTWSYEDPPKDHVPHTKNTILLYTTRHVPHLDRHPVPHQDHIYTRDLDYQLPDTTDRCRTYGWT